MNSPFTLTKTRFSEGLWEGVLTTALSGNIQPEVECTHLEQPLGGIEVKQAEDGNEWAIRVPIPASAIADGVQTFLIRDRKSGETLHVISLISGEALADDIRAEVELLRAELDMLKRAFRRHCLETS